MPKVTVNDARGLIQSRGTGIQFQSTPYATIQTQNVSSGTITAPGVYTISSSIAAGAISTIMPLASAVPGGVFVFRNLSADPNFLTGSAEAGGTRVFKSTITGSEPQGQGSKLVMFPGIGASVVLISDGFSYLAVANSGTLGFIQS
jgi:hypothetical protein